MKALLRLVIIGVVALAALAAAFALIPTAPAATDTGGVSFSSGEPVDVKAVTVKNESGEYSFFFEGDGYILDDIPPQIADLDAFIGFMTNCARLSCVRQIPLKDADLGAYGLLEPVAEAEIEFFDGHFLRLKVGGMERVSGNYYVQAEGFDGVYVMSRELAEPFLLPKTQIVSQYVTPALQVTSPLSAVRDITFTGAGLPRPVSILASVDGGEDVRLAALSFGAPTHIVRGNVDYQLDQTYGTEILGSLFGIAADGLAGYGLSAAELQAYGFDRPYMSVEYDMVNGADARPMRLMIADAGGGRFYATLDGSGALYTITRQPFMDLQYDKLILRWFLTPLIMDLSSVTVHTADTGYRFDIDNTDARNPVFTHDGKALDAALFRSFFRLVTSAAHDGAYLGLEKAPAPGDEKPLLSITYAYADPAKSPDTLTLYPGGPRRARVFVNGVSEFAMKDSFIQRVEEGCANLVAGNPIEENW